MHGEQGIVPYSGYSLVCLSVFREMSANFLIKCVFSFAILAFDKIRICSESYLGTDKFRIFIAGLQITFVAYGASA